jgi:hypothetical protein
MSGAREPRFVRRAARDRVGSIGKGRAETPHDAPHDAPRASARTLEISDMAACEARARDAAYSGTAI